MTERVAFHFDPTCPWTWITSRWLVDVAERRGVDVRWRALSLELLNDGEVPEDRVERARVARHALRVVEALADEGTDESNAAAGAFYTALGTGLHVEGEDPSPGLVARALDAAGIARLGKAADDPDRDTAVARAHEHACAIVCPGVGSPVLLWGDPPVGVFGPIVSPAPTGAEADRLWDAVRAIGEIDQFSELKRSRPARPDVT